ncbi:MAG: VIT and VWA domain-containing protein [Planctomycetota bacterium]
MRHQRLFVFVMVVGILMTCCNAGFAAGLLIADGGLGGILKIEEQDVVVTINNGIAVTTVEQVFLNTEGRVVEALYTFPVPKGASVAGFSMWINGKEMVGEVVEKERAREIYESYKPTRTDPGLLEQVDYKTFEMRIFPIPAGGKQRVKIRYYQQLDFDHDWATYVFPLQTDGRQDIDQQTTGRFSISLRVLSEIPIAELTSPSHPDDFVMLEHTPHFFEASFEQIAGDLAHDVVLAFRTERATTGCDIITSQPKDEDGYFMMTLTAGKELETQDLPMDYVFVLDISGSMANSGKLGYSRKSIEAFVEQLSPDDRFELLTFNAAPQALFGDLEPAESAPLRRAVKFLKSQEARGGTALRPALQLAYKYGQPDRPLNVVVLSDGLADRGDQRELMSLIRARPAYATVFAIGVGNEVNRPLLTQVAEEAGGLAAFLSRGDDFERQAAAFRRKLLRPAASSVAIDFTGIEVYDLVPAEIPNLYHGAPVRVFGRYRRATEPRVEVTADVLGREFASTDALDLGSGDNPEVERMWASGRVDQLQRAANHRGEEHAFQDEIVALGETYSIVTEYTSFIVLENDDEYRRWKIDRKNAKRIARDRAEHQQLVDRMEKMREDAMAGLGPDNGADAESPSPFPKSGSSVTTPEPSASLLTWLAFAWLLHHIRRRGAH